MGTLQILPESAPFSVRSDGTVTVKNSAALDRETTGTFTFQVTWIKSYRQTNRYFFSAYMLVAFVD